MPALIRRFHEAVQNGLDEVVIWGSGTPRREFLHVDDMAAASLFVLNLSKAVYGENTEPMRSHINVGTGTDVSILELAQLVAKSLGTEARLVRTQASQTRHASNKAKHEKRHEHKPDAS